jgi:hypothetical protein
VPKLTLLRIWSLRQVGLAAGPGRRGVQAHGRSKALTVIGRYSSVADGQYSDHSFGSLPS